MKLSQALILSLDTETTGPDPSQDRIVEIGGGYLQAGQQVGPMLRCLVNPQRYIPAGATQVHGIRNEDVQDAPLWPEVSARLKVHLDAHPVLCGYNYIAFDGPIIDAENKRNEIPWQSPVPLDPFIWISWFDRGASSRRLGDTCERYGVELPEDRAHTADADAFATGLLLTAMLEEGLLPDDVDEAFSEQMLLQRRLAAEYEKYGRFVFPDRTDGRFRIGLGKHCGILVDDAEESYLKWLVGRPDMPKAARTIVMKALGQVEQIGLF